MPHFECLRLRAALMVTSALISAALFLPRAHAADTAPLSEAEKAGKRAILQQQLDEIREQLRQLGGDPAAPTAAPGRPAAQAAPAGGPEVVVTGTADRIYDRPAGQTLDTVDRDMIKDTPAFSIDQVLEYVPGVTFKQGNGPRDVGVSIRGSNARNGFGVRNIQVLEDGFSVTQPDGLSRTDLTDPHAYGAIDVFKGPSSTMFGNYATGGAINFHTRPGGDINGFELGADFGSFGYFNDYATYGNKGANYEYALFGSHVRSGGYNDHNDFKTTTENILATYSPTASDQFTFKFINNDLSANLSTRLSLNQFNANPFQRGCGIFSAAAYAKGCAYVGQSTSNGGIASQTGGLFANGVSGAKVQQTATQADSSRSDRRTVVGVRWEHAIDADTTFRLQGIFDDKDINQPTGTTAARGSSPSFNFLTDLTRKATVAGFDATHYAGLYFNYYDYNNSTFNVAPGRALGALTNTTFGHVFNFGGRGREEIRITPAWTAAVGLSGEYTEIELLQTNYTNTTNPISLTGLPISTTYFNFAPEGSLAWRPEEDWLLHTRVSTGYGTPNPSALTTVATGLPGPNSGLKPQSNVGIDLGAEWTLSPTLRTELTGFYEFFEDEQISVAGSIQGTYTYNVPNSEHRGFEASADWRPFEGWRLTLAYLFDDQTYTNFIETLGSGAGRQNFNRNGRAIPGVEPHQMNIRLGYDTPSGPLAGLGGFIEMNWRDSFFMDNANLLRAPGYELVNLNLHYSPEIPGGFISGLNLFFEVQNLLDQVYVASANNVADALIAGGTQQNASYLAGLTGSIYAGAPRTFIGGLKMKF